MPVATVTVRELKNKNTGIDLSVPDYEEIPSRLKKVVEYHVTVVTNLPCFKSPRHKESDVVQFVINKKFADFEELYSRLNEKFSGLAFPPLPKKVLIALSDTVAKERRNGLDNLMRFLGTMPRIATSVHLLEFLGVSTNKAGKYESLVKKGDRGEKGNDVADGVDSEDTGEKTRKGKKDEIDIFGEKDEDDVELFSGNVEKKKADMDVFDSEVSTTRGAGNMKLFEDQDYGGTAMSTDTDLFILGDTSSTGAEAPLAVNKQKNKDDDDETDPDKNLLKVDDDLDAIMKLSLKPKGTDESSQQAVNRKSKPKPAPRKSKMFIKPQTKPPLAQKPQLPKKPVLPQKPETVSKTTVVKVNDDDAVVQTSAKMNADDLMKYIEDNSTADEVDLFS